MLQNKLLTGKTSDSVKQKMFERDLELEMLRRKKNYQLAGKPSFFIIQLLNKSRIQITMLKT